MTKLLTVYTSQQINGKRPEWGHNANPQKPYVAVGNFINIIPVIEELKQNLPNLRPLHHESTKYIQDVKRAERSIYKEGSIEPKRTVAFMEQGFKELKCEPKKQGANNRTHASLFDLQTKHINLKTVGANNADGIRKLMTTLEKQFMDDPEFILPEEEKAPSVSAGITATTGTFGAGDT